MHVAHPSSMVVAVDDNMMRSFPIVQVEIKIKVPDQLIGRLIGRNGQCLKKIMDDTATHIAISDARNQQEVHQYQTAEMFDRVITIRGNRLDTVLAAEKNVQFKLRQFYEQDLNMNAGQHFYNATPSGVIMNPVEHIGYIAPGSVPAPMIPRETYQTSYNPIPMGVSPQSFYIQNPATVAGFSISTGQYTHNVPLMPSLPNSVHTIKSRVYVPNQIVGILIGTKGQTIKSVIAESGAIISIEGDREPKKPKRDFHSDGIIEHKDNCSPNDGQSQNIVPSQEEQKQKLLCERDNLDLKSLANIEPINENKSPEAEKTVAEVSAADDKHIEEVKIKNKEIEDKSTIDLNGSQQYNVIMNVDNYHSNGTKKMSQQNNDQRAVFIQGYDFQVYKAQQWVFQKVAENQNVRIDDVMLTCEAIVPSKVIGRIIGKQGQNVKQLQIRSGAHIKVPDDINQNDKSCVEAAVRVIGNIYSVQMVQQHFAILVTESEWRDSREFDEKHRSRFREGSR